MALSDLEKRMARVTLRASLLSPSLEGADARSVATGMMYAFGIAACDGSELAREMYIELVQIQDGANDVPFDAGHVDKGLALAQKVIDDIHRLGRHDA